MTDDELAKVYSALSSLNRAEAKLQNGETQVESEIDAARLILLNLSEDASKPFEPKSSGHGREALLGNVAGIRGAMVSSAALHPVMLDLFNWFCFRH
jgi:hypothetical protein